MVTDVEQSLLRRETLNTYLNAFRSAWWVVALGAAVCSVAALGFSLLQTPQYKASATLYVTASQGNNTAAAYQGSLASQERVASYVKLAVTESVLADGVQRAGLNISADDAEHSVAASAASDTSILSISATRGSAWEATRLANGTAEALAEYVRTLETPAGGGSPLAKLTVVAPASEPSSPISPRTGRNVVLGAVVGLLIGAGWVVVRTKYNTRIHTESDLVAALGVPVLAGIPHDGRFDTHAIAEFSSGGSVAGEAFRKLRTALSFVSIDNPPSVLVVTSAVAAEGKTTVSINLAAALADTGRSVCLVDADLRRPQVAGRLGLNENVGLTDWLSATSVELVDLVQSTATDGLTVLASGSIPPNPAELLQAQRVGEGLRVLAAKFDYVVVDSAPVLPVADTVSLCQWGDGVVLVARSDASRTNEVRDAVAHLAVTETPVLGGVLTDLARDALPYGYGYGYGYALLHSNSDLGESTDVATKIRS